MQLDQQKMFITGASGFIGSHLCQALLAEGAQVRALCRFQGDLQPPKPHWLTSHWASRFEWCLGDVRDPVSVQCGCQGCDGVFHLASLASADYSQQAYYDNVDVNVSGTLNVLQAARASGVQKMIYVSSADVYAKPQGNERLAEDNHLEAYSPYGATKIAADKLIESFALSFALPVIRLRLFNTYGPRQATQAVIPTIISQMVSGAERLLLGDLTNQSDFTYIDDVIQACLQAYQLPLASGEIFNIGSGQAASIQMIIDTLFAYCQRSWPIKRNPKWLSASRPSAKICQTEKAKQYLNWQATTPLAEGLRRTYNAFGKQSISMTEDCP